MSSNLLYRKQFLLGDKPVAIDGWKHYPLNFGLVLTAHPDLNVVISVKPQSILVLLGYMLDAENPDATDNDILMGCHSEHVTIESLVRKTESLSGRWILLYASKEDGFIMNDACGMRDVYYTISEGITWCGSQPHLLATYLNIAKSNEADFVRYFSTENIKTLNYKWTTDYTAYQGIFHLQPNHYIDLKSALVKRFHLNFTESILPINQVIAENSKLLTGIMLAAHKRSKLILGCTAGYDSRVLLAACRNIAPALFFYIYQFPYMNDSHPDMIVPLKMFKSMGLPFHVIRKKHEYEEDFLEAYNQNVMYPRPAIQPCIYHQYKEYQDCLNVSENTLPIVKVFFDRLDRPDAIKLAGIYHQPFYPFILDWMQNWLNEVSEIVPDDRINISDLYFWEIFLANLCGSAATEQDIAIDDLSPSNCRRFILNCFSVHPKYHSESFSYVFHDKMIDFMWNELSQFPINPGLKSSLMYHLRRKNMFFRLKKLKANVTSLMSSHHATVAN